MTRNSILFTPVNSNPYQHLLTKALADVEITVLHRRDIPPIHWQWAHRHSVKVIHIHWIQGLYRGGIFTPLTFLRFIFRVLVAKHILGYKFVWTAHNIFPHNSYSILLDWLGRKFVVSQCNRIIALCEFSKREIRDRYSENADISIIPIGTYHDIYPDVIEKDAARQKLAIDSEDFVYLYFGIIRPYKGVSNLVKAFNAIPADKKKLLICGNCPSKELKDELFALADNNPNITFVFDYIPDEDIQNYFQASNVVVLPFNEVTTSSSVMLSMAYGRPVIVPRLGCLPEYVNDNVGWIYDPEVLGSLDKCMQSAAENLTHESFGQNAYKYVREDKFSWKTLSKQTAEIYESI